MPVSLRLGTRACLDFVLSSAFRVGAPSPCVAQAKNRLLSVLRKATQLYPPETLSYQAVLVALADD